MKKKKKKDTFSIAEQNIKILKSGKVKVKKGQKISLSPYVTDSVNNAVVSRLDAIISKADVVIDTASKLLVTSTNLSSMKRTVELLTKIDSPIVYTLVHTINKKDATDVFDFMDDGVIGSLLRSSTLASIYKELKPNWVELNTDDKTSFTNVLFIPKILVFLDETTGKIRKRPYVVNLLLVVEPSTKDMATGLEKLSNEEVTDRIVKDVFTSAIKCGARNLIVNPYCHKALMVDEHYTSDVWKVMSEVQPSIENIDTIDYSVGNDDLYIIFNKNRIGVTETKF